MHSRGTGEPVSCRPARPGAAEGCCLGLMRDSNSVPSGQASCAMTAEARDPVTSRRGIGLGASSQPTMLGIIAPEGEGDYPPACSPDAGRCRGVNGTVSRCHGVNARSRVHRLHARTAAAEPGKTAHVQQLAASSGCVHPPPPPRSALPGSLHAGCTAKDPTVSHRVPCPGKQQNVSTQE